MNNNMLWVTRDEPSHMADAYWIIVYQNSERKAIETICLSGSSSYMENEYFLASRYRFLQEDEATAYCRKLAKESGLACEIDGDVFLD